MFKYLKTANSDFHPAEIYSFISPASENESGEVRCGSMVSVSFGEISQSYTGSTPMYLAITSKKYNESKQVKCIRLTSGMILEADVDPGMDSSSFFLGAVCDAMEDLTGKGAYLTRDGNANFEIIDISNISKGKVTVIVI